MDYIKLREIQFENEINHRIFVTFVARDIQIRLQKDQIKKYITFNMVDKDKIVEARIFSVSDDTIKKMENNRVYKAAVDVQPYAKSPTGYSCVIYNIDYCDIPIEEYVDWGKNIEYYQSIVEGYLRTILQGVYGTLVYTILNDNWEKFRVWAAGKSFHHTKLGELVIHTAEVAQICDLLSSHFCEVYGEKFINRDLLTASALLHDIGKLSELSTDSKTGAVEYTTMGTLLNHIVVGCTMISETAIRLGFGKQAYADGHPMKDEEVVNSEKEALMLLLHSIASHHGDIEYGSPVKPMIPEACILHLADDVSAKMYRIDKLFSEMQPESTNNLWTNSGLESTYKDSTK